MQVLCPSCQHAVSSDDAEPGGDITCPSCGSTFQTQQRETIAETVDPHATRAGRADDISTEEQSTPHLPIISGYEILGILGRGGMGVVYKARHLALKRVVAFKMILAGGHADAEQVARFRAEAEAVARLQHPNIVQIHEIGERDGLPYFSLEYCEAGSLAAKLNGTPLPPKDAAAIVETLARAMDYAHKRGVIHRDLKPANVLLQTSEVGSQRSAKNTSDLCPLTSDFSPKITDFGLAKKLDASAHTASGAVMGTPSYMAPEQAAGKTKEIGPAVDVYALGAILYELLTGRPPFKAATMVETLRQVLHEQPVAPRQLNRNLPRDLETICLKCLEKEARSRYTSATALASELRRLLNGEPIEARPLGRFARLARRCRRNPWQTGFFVASLLLVAGLITIFVLQAVEAKERELEAQLQRPPNEPPDPPIAPPPADCLLPPNGLKAVNDPLCLQVKNESGKRLLVWLFPRFFEREDRGNQAWVSFPVDKEFFIEHFRGGCSVVVIEDAVTKTRFNHGWQNFGWMPNRVLSIDAALQVRIEPVK